VLKVSIRQSKKSINIHIFTPGVAKDIVVDDKKKQSKENVFSNIKIVLIKNRRVFV